MNQVNQAQGYGQPYQQPYSNQMQPPVYGVPPGQFVNNQGYNTQNTYAQVGQNVQAPYGNNQYRYNPATFMHPQSQPTQYMQTQPQYNAPPSQYAVTTPQTIQPHPNSSYAQKPMQSNYQPNYHF